MSETFTKLFSSITDSSVWAEDHATVRVWITLLAMADQHGYVGAAVPGLAGRARVTVVEVESALAKFLAPDPYSRSKEHDGRRIEVSDRGWTLLNHSRFRDMRDEEVRKTYERERKQKQRAAAKVVPDGPGLSRDVPVSPGLSAQAEAETEAEGKAGKTVVMPDSPKPDPLIDGVLAALRDATRALKPKSTGARDSKTNRALIRKPVRECGATLEDWQNVIAWQLASVRSDPEAWGFLSLQTLGRPVNFQRILDRGAPRGATAAPVQLGVVRDS